MILQKNNRLSFMKNVLPKYFSSEWSFAHFTIPLVAAEKYHLAFGETEDIIIVITTSGKYYKFKLETSKNQIVAIGQNNFL